MLSQLTENSDYHIKRDDQTTMETFSRKLMPLQYAFKTLASFGQSQFRDIRQNENVINVFSHL